MTEEHVKYLNKPTNKFFLKMEKYLKQKCLNDICLAYEFSQSIL